MAPPLSRLLLLLGLLLCASAGADTIDGGHRLPSQPHYASIFSFGDSLTDTGNALRILGSRATVSLPPYGETFFGHPNGRASDGRIMIDFIAEALGVPQLTPYLLAGKTAADFDRGVNFAVGGGTALDPAFFESRGLTPFLPVSLRNQTSWFHNVLQVLGTEQRNVTASSLFIVGEIGINDYLIGIIGNRTLAELTTTFLPPIIGAIHSAITDVIAAGARTVVVPGSIPIGCEPVMMFYQGQLDAAGYDAKTGCITWLNHFAHLHNRALRNMIRGLRRVHPGTSILYADLYRPVTNLIVSPGRYGFGDMPLGVCCGGAYHFEVSCGAPGTKTCPDPSAYISWDGVHFTEAANRQIACAVLQSLWPTQEAGCRM